ncbi:hypothetical protein ACFVGM_09125 [Kitasatospora purpeofusca]|uniref:hypothetical protein n=1 Tax=Kitasatospora purpeofusca TaxID=67352 RepID=UPI003677E479
MRTFTNPRKYAKWLGLTYVNAYVAGRYFTSSARGILDYLDRLARFGIITPAEYKIMRSRVCTAYEQAA